MYRVVILPPPAAVRQLEEYRRRLDPAFHRLPLHVPVAVPFERTEATVYEEFDRTSRVSRFELELGAAEIADERLELPVTRGAEHVTALSRALADAFGIELPGRDPALLLGRSSSAAELELAARGLDVVERPDRLSVDQISLLVEDARGLWVVARTRPLR